MKQRMVTMAGRGLIAAGVPGVHLKDPQEEDLRGGGGGAGWHSRRGTKTLPSWTHKQSRTRLPGAGVTMEATVF